MLFTPNIPVHPLDGEENSAYSAVDHSKQTVLNCLFGSVNHMPPGFVVGGTRYEVPGGHLEDPFMLG